MARPSGGQRKRAISVTLNREDLTLFLYLGKGNVSEGIAEVTRKFRALSDPKELNKLVKAAEKNLEAPLPAEENELFS